MGPEAVQDELDALAVRLGRGPALGMAARLCLPVRHRGDCLGYLWLPRPEVPLSAGELADLHRASSRFGELLSRGGSPAESAWGGRAIDRLVGRLYEQVQAEAHSRLAAAVPALVDGTVRLVAAVPGRPDRTGVRTLTSTEYSALAAALTPTLRAHPGYVGSYVAADYALLLHRDAGPAPYRAHGPHAVPPDRLLDSLLDSLLDATTEVVARCLGPGHVCTSTSAATTRPPPPG